MDKQDLIKIFAVLIVVGFITELFFFGGGFFNLNLSDANSAANITGSAILNGTIRTYDPIVLLPLDTDPAVLAALQTREEVKSVQKGTQWVVVATETRDDVYPLGVYLRTINVTPYAIANVADAHELEMQTQEGKMNVTIPTSVIRVFTEPFLDADNTVTVSLVGIINDGSLIDYTSADILVRQVDIEADGKIDALESTTYTYLVPWQERNLDLSPYDNVTYSRKDLIIFKTPLAIDQIFIKKQLPYIAYIDDGSASVESNFTDSAIVESDFAGIQFELPVSKLVIVTDAPISLPYDHTTEYAYDIVLTSTGNYTLGQNKFTVHTSKEYALNDEIKVNVTVLSAGNQVLSVKRVVLPS